MKTIRKLCKTMKFNDMEQSEILNKKKINESLSGKLILV